MRFVAIAVAVAACSSPSPVTTPAAAPRLAAEGGSDQADHDCQVILRQLLRVDLSPTGSGDWETDGSDWVFVATVETSGSAVPSVLYQNGSTWLAASDAVAIAGAPPGSSLWTITLDSQIGDTLQAIPYVTLANGARLFDHNRLSDDGASYVLDPDNDFSIWESDAQGTCQPPSDSRSATLAFTADWQATRAGVIVPGGSVTIDYATSRAPACRGAGWDIAAHVLFTNAPEQIIASVASGSTSFTVPPDGASQLVIWFENTDSTGCDSYDSNDGANYTFAVETRPQWLGDATNLLSQSATDACAGGADANQGFTLDGTARSFDSRSDLCFQVYQPGVTDFPNTDIWQQLDSNVHWQLTTMTGETAWFSTPVDFNQFVGNNAQYAFAWEQIDPFRANHCPELTPDPIGNGLVQIQVQYYVTVNNGAINGNNETGYFFGNFIAPAPASCD
ncbi:MAG TPA: DUF6209 family protein [Kofleriaceae bacterium]|nr:DUF6209 family protein [Kofleriaceae bacterium]